MIKEQDANNRRRRHLAGKDIAGASTTARVATDSMNAHPSLLQHLKKWKTPANQYPWVDAQNEKRRRRRSLASANDLYGLKALLVTNLTAPELETAFRDWPVALGTELGYGGDEPCFPRALDYMLHDEFIPWMEVYVCSQVSVFNAFVLRNRSVADDWLAF